MGKGLILEESKLKIRNKPPEGLDEQLDDLVDLIFEEFAKSQKKAKEDNNQSTKKENNLSSIPKF